MTYKSKHTLYKTWLMMLRRCTNPKAHNWRLYGGRGITVCGRWTNSFDDFTSDLHDKLGTRPKKHELDRIDNNDGYHIDNVRWVTRSQNLRNKRNNLVLVADDGTAKCQVEWFEIAQEKTGISYPTFRSRISRGWSVDEAIYQPIAKRTKRKAA